MRQSGVPDAVVVDDEVDPPVVVVGPLVVGAAVLALDRARDKRAGTPAKAP